MSTGYPDWKRYTNTKYALAKKFDSITIPTDGTYTELLNLTGKGYVKQIGIRFHGTNLLTAITDKWFRYTIDGDVTEESILEFDILTGGRMNSMSYGVFGSDSWVMPETTPAGAITGLHKVYGNGDDYMWLVIVVDTYYDNQFKLEFRTSSGDYCRAMVVCRYYKFK